MERLKVIRWDVELFGRSVLLVHCEDERKAIRAFNEYATNYVDLVVTGDANGWVQDKHGDVFIWSSTYSVMVHEFVHAAFRLCSLSDIEPSEELLARLVQWMKLHLMDEWGNGEKDREYITKEQIDKMVDRFLGWRLPDDFCPDAGITFEPEYNTEYMAVRGKLPCRHEPTGTNLLTADQARSMVLHMIGEECPEDELNA